MFTKYFSAEFRTYDFLYNIKSIALTIKWKVDSYILEFLKEKQN